MALIEIKNVYKTYIMGGEKLNALDGVTLDIEQGESVSIMGSSGSGKTTLMNVIGVLDPPTKGTYHLEHLEIEKLNDNECARIRNQNIGFVFQSFHLLPRSTAIRNVEMPLVYSASYDRKLTGDRMYAMALDALTKVGLQDRINHLPNELSGGQRQRVAIARAIVNRPKILIADEPTGALDAKSGQEVLKIFEELNSQGVTLIMVTHDPKVASHCKRQIVLNFGKIVSDSKFAGVTS